MSPARADTTEVNITGLVASFILRAHLLPAVHFCLFVLVGRIPLVEVEKLGPCLPVPRQAFLSAVPTW